MLNLLFKRGQIMYIQHQIEANTAESIMIITSGNLEFETGLFYQPDTHPCVFSCRLVPFDFIISKLPITGRV